MKERFPRAERPPVTLEDVYYKWLTWITNPIGGDPGIAMLGEAFVNLAENNENFRESVADSLKARQDPNYFYGIEPKTSLGEELSSNIGPEFAANLVRTAAQYNFLCLPRSDKRYPVDFHSAADIEVEVASWFKEDASKNYTRKDEFESNIVRRLIATNYYKRAVGIKLAKLVYGDEFPERIYAADVGCSQNEVLAQLVMDLPFDNFRILADDPSRGIILPHPAMSTAVNQEIAQPLNLGYGLGIDIHNPYDPDNSNWSWSSRRPSELVDRDLMNYDYRLTTFKDKRLGFYLADFRDLDDVRQAIHDNEAIDQPINLVSILTAMYELPSKVVGQFLSNAADLVSEDGVVLMQEPVEIDPSAPNGLRFSDDFRVLGAYKLIAWWPHKKDRGYELVATYDSARCHNAYLNPELLADRGLNLG